MPEPATLEAPKDNAQDIFKSVTSFEVDPSTQPQQQAPKPPVEAKPEVVTSNPALETAAKKKSPLDKIGAVSKSEEKKAEELKTGEDAKTQDGKQGDKEINYRAMREKLEAAEKKAQEYDKLTPEYETTKAELAKLKAMGLNEEERKEFQRMREMNAVEAVRSSQDFQQKVMAPIQKRLNSIKSVATNAKLTPQQGGSLLDACDIEDEFQRNKTIRSIVKGIGEDTDLEPEDYQALADSAIASARDLQDNLYPKHDEALAKAGEVQMAARSRQQQEGQQQTHKQQEEMRKAHEEVYGILSSDKLKPVLDEPDLAIDGVTMADAMKNAEPASSPQDRAFEVQAAAALPFVIAFANKALAKAASHEQAIKLRNGASPSRTDGGTKIQKADGEKPLTADEVFKGAGVKSFS